MFHSACLSANKRSRSAKLTNFFIKSGCHTERSRSAKPTNSYIYNVLHSCILKEFATYQNLLLLKLVFLIASIL